VHLVPDVMALILCKFTVMRIPSWEPRKLKTLLTCRSSGRRSHRERVSCLTGFTCQFAENYGVMSGLPDVSLAAQKPSPVAGAAEGV